MVREQTVTNHALGAVLWERVVTGTQGESQRMWAEGGLGTPDLPGCFQSGPYSKSSSDSRQSCTAHCTWSSTHQCHNDPGWGSPKSLWPPSDLSVTTGCCPGTWRARRTCQGHSELPGAFPHEHLRGAGRHCLFEGVPAPKEPPQSSGSLSCNLLSIQRLISKKCPFSVIPVSFSSCTTTAEGKIARFN